MRRHVAAGALVFSLALFGAACSSNDSGGGGSSGGGEGGSGGGGGGGGTTIVAQNIAFQPDQISVPTGTVSLTVTNKDSVQHTFTLDDDSSSTDLDPGSTQTIELDVTETVGWHCKIHPSMTGTIEVT